MRYDCLVAGGGPAGLSAALMLGRCRRHVLVCDAGEPRNRWAEALHAFLTRDGISPARLLALGREELRSYPTVSFREGRVVDAVRDDAGFRVTCEDGTEFRTRKLLLATGLVDSLPDLEGIENLYGRSVHHCPYCDGWEWRDRPVASYGRGEAGAGLALALTVWSGDVLLCTDGPAALPRRARMRLERRRIRVREERVRRLEGRDGRLERIVFEAGADEQRAALFFATTPRQASELPARLGCRFTKHGAVATGKCEATNVPGLYVCGDASKEAQFAVVAAAEGAEAGMAINQALLESELASGQKSSSKPSRPSLGGP